MIEGSIISIAAARRDKLFNNIVRDETNHQLEQFLLSGGGTVNTDGLQTWSPIMDKGREDGLVRECLSNVRILELIVNVQALLLLRDEYGKDEQRKFLKDLLVPAVLKDQE